MVGGKAHEVDRLYNAVSSRHEPMALGFEAEGALARDLRAWKPPRLRLFPGIVQDPRREPARKRKNKRLQCSPPPPRWSRTW